MTVHTNTGRTPDTEITAGGAAGSWGDPYSGVIRTQASNAQYRSYGGNVVTSHQCAVGEQSILYDDNTAASKLLSQAGRLRIRQAPSAACEIITPRYSSGKASGILCGTGRTLQARSGADANVGAATPALTIDEWYPWKLACDAGSTTTNGRTRFQLLSPDGSTILLDAEATNLDNKQANLVRAQWAKLTTSPSAWFEFDDVRVSPGVYDMIPTAFVNPDANVVGAAGYVIDATSSIPGGGGSLTYQIGQTSGPTHAPTPRGTGVWTVDQDPTTPTEYTIIVTEGGNTDTVSLVVPVAAAASVGHTVREIWDGSAWV